MSTRRGAAALACPSPGPSAGRGPRRTSGPTVADDPLPGPSLQETTGEGHRETRRSQRPWRHKAFAPPWTVVSLATTPVRPQARAPVVLGSRDVTLADAPLGDDDSLRCHIAVHGRDATQDWGVADGMPVTPTGVTQGAQLSWCRVPVASSLRADRHARAPLDSVLALTADCRGDKDGEDTRQMLPETPAPVLVAKMLHQVASLGRMHAAQPSFSFSELAKILILHTKLY